MKLLTNISILTGHALAAVVGKKNPSESEAFSVGFTTLLILSCAGAYFSLCAFVLPKLCN